MSKDNLPENIRTACDQAVANLRSGKIVAFPTESYYGLAVDPENDSAVRRLYAAKFREKDKPLLLLVGNIEQLGDLVQMIPPQYLPLMKKFWPGPLTLVFPAKAGFSPLISGNSGTVGVRISPHPIARKLVQKMGRAITATSANISGHPPARSALEVTEMFGNNVDYIVDGGPADAGSCSTVLGLKNGRLVLIRRGLIDLSEELANQGKFE